MGLFVALGWPHPEPGCWEQRGDGAKARELLRAGGKLVVHCRGGIGRAGALPPNNGRKTPRSRIKMMDVFWGESGRQNRSFGNVNL